jgi:hypothetical protein
MRVSSLLPLLAFPLVIAACRPAERAGPCADGLAAFEGAFGAEPADAVVAFRARDGELLMHPALWSGPMVLARVEADSFVVVSHPRFGATFVRGADGCVRAASVRGLDPEGAWSRLDTDRPRPVQLLAAGRPREAASAYLASGPADPDGLERIARMYLRSLPSRAGDAAAFLAALTEAMPRSAGLHTALGDAFLAQGHRGEARAAYENALAVDPENGPARAALERLGALPTGESGGWSLPFDLADALAPPSASEIEAARSALAARDLDPDAPRIVGTREVAVNGTPHELRTVEHGVHGSRHVGVVLVPAGVPPGGLPVLVEAKGVSPSFFPLEVPGGLSSPGFMEGVPVIYAAPGYRGERIVVGPDTLVSEGDRSDAWDGAADDLVAFLRVALAVTPEADTSRVCVFGRSRGGTVALLAGMRHRGIDCVVSWAAPTDWFRLMDLDGWTQAELVADGLRHRAVPGETGGQFIHYFLRRAIDGEEGLEEARRRMILSSPLYFADRLPLTQAHWGLEDSIVPAVNGQEFVARYGASGRSAECLDARFHPDAGHDQDRQLAPRWSRAFIESAFAGEGDAAGCRP